MFQQLIFNTFQHKMASTINKVIVVGNIGKDPDIRLTQNNNEIANISIATSESWKDKSSGEKKERTEWHKVVVFVPQLVDIIKKYCRKGGKLYVEGALQTRKWVDQSGTEKYITEIVVQSYGHTVVLLDNSDGLREGGGGGMSGGSMGGRGGMGGGSGGHGGGGSSHATYDLSELNDSALNDEIPF